MIEQQHDELCYLQFSQYLASTELTHGIFTRTGGYSEGVFHSLNTSALNRTDDYVKVAQNRALTLQTLHIEPPEAVTLWQVHGARVQTYRAEEPWRTDWANRSYWEQAWSPETIRKGDALLTRERGVALALSFADCTPLFFYDPVTQAIGLAHGGWRGTARGIALATVEAMQQQFGSLPQNILAGIGPTIGPCCYEVSEQVRQIFLGITAFEDEPTALEYQKAVRESAVFTTRQLADRESLRLDLQSTNHNQLLMAGLLPDHIESADLCTSCNTERFFSHRAEHGKTGRFPTILMLKEK